MMVQQCWCWCREDSQKEKAVAWASPDFWVKLALEVYNVKKKQLKYCYNCFYYAILYNCII